MAGDSVPGTELPPIDGDYIRQINLYYPEEAQKTIVAYLHSGESKKQSMRASLESAVKDELFQLVMYFDASYEEEPKLRSEHRSPEGLDKAIEFTLVFREHHLKSLKATERALFEEKIKRHLSISPDEPIKREVLAFIDQTTARFYEQLPLAKSALHLYLFEVYTSGFDSYAAKPKHEREQLLDNITRYLKALSAHPGAQIVDDIVTRLRHKSNTKPMLDRGCTDKAHTIEACFSRLPLEAFGHIGDESYAGVGVDALKALHQAIAQPRSQKEIEYNDNGTINLAKASQSFRTLKDKLRTVAAVESDLDIYTPHSPQQDMKP